MKKFIFSVVVALIVSFGAYAQSVSTSPATSITQTAATLNGTADPIGAPSNVMFGIVFQYGTDSTATLTDVSSHPNFVSGAAGALTADLTGLTSGTTYYYRVQASGLVGSYTSYFAEFTTSSASAPTVESDDTVKLITTTTADLCGDVTDNGGSAVTTRGICYSTGTNPTTGDNIKASGSGTGKYYPSMTGLTAGTQYYVRAYATNSVGTSYGAQREFKTVCNAPSSSAATDVEGVSFYANWSAPSGGSAIDNYVLDVATDAGFTSMVSGYEDLNVGTVTTYQVTGLTAQTGYFFRVRAANNGGADGEDTESTNSSTQSVTTISIEPATMAVIDSMVSAADGELTIYFTAGNGTGRILYGRSNNSITDFPSDGTDGYTASTVFGNGSDLGNNTYVLYEGSGAKGSVTITNLDAVNDYYFKIDEYNGSGSNTNYNAGGTQSNSADDSNLPIELLSFEATADGQHVYLNWETATEENNDYFLLASSADGVNFTTIDKINGAGTSAHAQSYQAVDMNPLADIMYYQLSQVDFDGTKNACATIAVELSGATGIDIGHTEVEQGQISVLISKDAYDVQLEVLNVNGQSVYNTVLSHEGSATIQIPMSNFAKGVYLIRIYNENHQSVEKKIIF